MNKKLKYALIFITAFFILLIILKSAGVLGKGEDLKVTAEKPVMRTITETVSASGKVQPETEVKISPDVSGEIVELEVKEGDQVKKGDLLCRIKPDLYISNQERAIAAVSTAKANYANTKARLAQIEAQFKNIEATYNRTKKLFEQNAVSQSEFDNARSQHEAGKADIDAAIQSLAAAEYNINSAQASLKEANDNLSRTSIFSPVDGKISKLNVEKGERVVGTSQMAGTEMMKIADLNEMEVSVDVNENDILRISLGDTSDIEIDAYRDKKFKGVVTEIANSANTTGMNAEQVTNFPVKIRILKESYADLIPEGKTNYSPFRPGMSATVEVRTETVKNALSIPIQSVTTRVDSTKDEKGENIVAKDIEPDEVVFVNASGKAAMKKVKTGIQDNTYIQILNGLSKEDEVVTGPYSAVSRQLKNDKLIQVVPKEELYNNEE